MIKLTFKHLLVVSMILTLFLGLSLVSATDVTDDSAVSTKNICTHSITSDNNNDNIDVNDINNYVKNTVTSTSANNGSNSDENINGNTGGASNGGTIKDLNETINGGSSSNITLDKDYTYNAGTDSGLTDGIVVSRNLTIDGQGHTIDLGEELMFLESSTSGINLVLKNLIIKNGVGNAVRVAYGNCNIINSVFININAGYGPVYIEYGNGSFINSTFNSNGANVGGAVYLLHSNGIFINTTFINNTAYYGGAVQIYNGTGNFINSTFTNNTGTEGGAVDIDGNGSGSFINSTFNSNGANVGGAVYINGNGSFINSTFIGNSANNAAGAVYINGNGSFINSTFTDNNATQHGGAVYITGGNGSFINSTFTGNNVSASGGAVSIEKGNGSFINSTFTGNKANRFAGAVSIEESNGIFIGSTFTSNNAGDEGGAVYIIRGNGSFINSTFTSNNATTSGGAVFIRGNGSFINSTFTDNNVSASGGAVFIRGNGSFINSTFTGNNAGDDGGAIFHEPFRGTAILCRFNTKNDNIINVDIIPASINVLGYISTYQSGEKLEFNLTADDMLFDGFNTTIDIFKDGKLVKTVYGLTGEGWIVDLNPGVYTAVLSLTDYPAEKSSNATLNISKANTTVVIDPIVDAVLGKEVLINFTTNSNGTATIKVNGVPINSATFTPTHAGTYNVTVEVAENECYNAGSAETNFTVEKLASSILADSVSTTYTVDKFLVISLKDSNGNPISGADLSVNLRGIKNYTTNEDGQVLINIAKLYPKTYNAMITYAGSDNFNGSTGSAKVTVNKITSTIIAKSPTFKLNQNIKKYTITLKYLSGKLIANKKVTLNFNGKTYAVKTNNKGQGVFKIYKHLKKGVYNAVITVPENSYYNKVIKKVKITVK